MRKHMILAAFAAAFLGSPVVVEAGGKQVLAAITIPDPTNAGKKIRIVPPMVRHVRQLFGTWKTTWGDKDVVLTLTRKPGPKEADGITRYLGTVKSPHVAGVGETNTYTDEAEIVWWKDRRGRFCVTGGPVVGKCALSIQSVNADHLIGRYLNVSNRKVHTAPFERIKRRR